MVCSSMRSILELLMIGHIRVTRTWSTQERGRLKLLHEQHNVIQSITLGFLDVLLYGCYNKTKI
jgi:hypothetical protein